MLCTSPATHKFLSEIAERYVQVKNMYLSLATCYMYMKLSCALHMGNAHSFFHTCAILINFVLCFVSSLAVHGMCQVLGFW